MATKRPRKPFAPLVLPELTNHAVTPSGLPAINLLDHIQGVSKEIAPYQCASCEHIFKRINTLAIHNKFRVDLGRCPTTAELINRNLIRIKHTANGNQYDCWDLTPSVKPTGAKDEVLQDLEKRAFGIVPHLTLPIEKEAQS
jgi:hypothetical protein